MHLEKPMRAMLRNLGARSALASRASAPGDDPNTMEAAQRLAVLDEVEAAGAGWFWATDAEHRLTYLSPAAARHFAGGRKLAGEPFGILFEMVSGENDERTDRPLSFLLGARSRFVDLTVRIPAEDGEAFWALTGIPRFDSESRFRGYRGSARDVTGAYLARYGASRPAEFDPLTSLANRQRMAERLSSMLMAFKVARRSCALLALNLDRFKHVNDTLGYPAGDDLLREAARRLRHVTGEPAEIGRTGGDAFQILIPDVDDRGRLGELAQRIIQIVSQPYSIDGTRVMVGASAGIAIAPYDGLEPETLAKAADLALHASKRGGRGQYRFYSNDLKDAARERREVEDDLRGVLARGELEMRYQPVVRADNNRVCLFEAQVHWNHRERGIISPAVFIPVAEDSGLICAIGEWALRQACMDAAKWPGNIPVAVNVSARQFASGNLPVVVEDALAASGLQPRGLELAVTENVFMADAEAADSTFRRLKKIGVKLSLDGFGTGYSSLGHLRRAPFDKIRIDQTFVRGCTEKGNTSSAIITAIVSLANALGVETTAAGVEAMDELALVRELGATNVQGFIYSRAVAQDEVLAKLGGGALEYQAIGPDKYRPERRALFRKIGVIHEDVRYEAVLRNLSRTGAMIEGLLDVPVGTDLVIDLGEGQLAVATVRRSQDATQGVEFETPLISDGAGGLCTRHRVSPYSLAAAGTLSQALAPEQPATDAGAPSRPRFVQVDVSASSSRAA